MKLTAPAPMMSVHSSADVALVLGIVPRAPALPRDVATLVTFAGPRSVRVDSIRDMIAETLQGARAAR